MERPRLVRDWRHDPDGVAPTVLILGGFLTSPPLYRPLARRLIQRGAANVLIGRIWTPDWLLAVVRGLGPITTRAGRSLLAASSAAAASPASASAPVLVIGHSAGGIVARILTAMEPFEGRRFGASERIGALVTLGTPHRVGDAGDLGNRVSAVAVGFADRVVPGAFFAPRVGYLAVAARGFPGRPAGGGQARVSYRIYQGLLPQPGAIEIEGDGIVPVAAALLDGARQLTLHGVGHGVLSGSPWYGSEAAIDRWWPSAVDVWRATLRIRARDLPAGDPAIGAPHPP